MISRNPTKKKKDPAQSFSSAHKDVIYKEHNS